jgi:hypothetical protein
MGSGTAIDVSKPGNTRSLSGDVTLTFSNATPTTGTRTLLKLTTDSTPRTVTIPTTYSLTRNAAITTVVVPASSTLLVQFEYNSAQSRWEIIGDPAATTGSGSLVLATGPTLVAPALGVATATTLNGLTVTSSTGTLTIGNGKTATVSNTLTFTGTDGATLNIGAGGTLSGTNTGDQNLFGSVAVSGQTTVTAASNPTTLTFVAGDNMAITTNNTTKEITFASTGVSDTAFASSWNGVTTTAPSKNAVYDWAHTFDSDDDGKVNVLDMGAGLVKTDAGGNVSVASAGTDYATPAQTTGTIVVNIGDGINTITTGEKVTSRVRVPFACTLTGTTIGANESGSITVDVWKDTTANYPPITSIVNGNKITLSSATHAEDTDITNWSMTTVDAGDWLAFSVDSVTACKWVQIQITYSR